MPCDLEVTRYHDISVAILMISSDKHYSDVIMSAMASQITGVSITYFSDADQRKYQKAPRHWLLCEGNSPVNGEFPAQRDSNGENVFIWWRHHGKTYSI